MANVTLQEVKQALIIDHNDDDEALELAIEAASERINAYLKRDDDGETPALVRSATILLVRRLYKPEGQFDDDLQLGHLPRSITMMIHHLRTLTTR